jgi:hypothetical protein
MGQEKGALHHHTHRPDRLFIGKQRRAAIIVQGWPVASDYDLHQSTPFAVLCRVDLLL